MVRLNPDATKLHGDRSRFESESSSGISIRQAVLRIYPKKCSENESAARGRYSKRAGKHSSRVKSSASLDTAARVALLQVPDQSLVQPVCRPANREGVSRDA